ncbi:MAG: sensor histidine kinase [Armatimonadota bacterium]
MPGGFGEAYVTAGVYWALILCWSAILVFYAREYRHLRKLNPLIATLIVVIFIDGARTLVESLYFGTWYTGRTPLLPHSVYEVLSEPQYVILPKAVNLIAALIIILVIVRNWFPRVEEETRRHQELERLYRELQEAEKSRDELYDLIVHDLRSPMTSVMGTLEMLRDQSLEEATRRELLNAGLAAGESVLATANQLLEVSRLEAGQVVIERARTDLGALVEEALQQVRPQALDKRIGLETRMPDEPIELLADGRMLARVLVNLVDNGVKFTPEGGQVTVAAELVEGGTQVQVSVSDTGSGISEESLGRVFDKFFRAERPEQAKRVGTGLGLAFCRLAVEAHGGRIWAESRPGEGSTFRFALPLAPQP